MSDDKYQPKKIIGGNGWGYTREQIAEGLSQLDEEANGSILTVELKRLLTTLGDKMTDQEVDALLMDIKCQSGGFVDLNEFVRVIFDS